MTVENLPHWTIRPNWRSPVIERLEWMTAVHASPTGAEQRFGLRWTPRRSFEALMSPVGPARALFDLAVGAVGPAHWYIPVWHDVSTLTATQASGDTTLDVDTIDREFQVGGFVMLRLNDFTSEVLEVASMTATSLTFTTGPVGTWPAGTKVYPALKASLQTQPSMSRIGSRVFEGMVRFTVEGDTPWTGAEADETPYGAFPVLTVPPDEGQEMTHEYARLFAEHDSETGLIERVNTSEVGYTVQGYNWLALGRRDLAELRSAFYALEGRLNLMWVPTFADDFEVVEAIDSADTSLLVRRNGFTDYGGPRTNREDIQIALRGGTMLFRHITGSALAGSTQETITLSAAIGQDVAVSEILRVSFVAVCRMDTDVIEISHITDARGAAQTAASFRTVPNIRDADVWLPPDLPSTTKTEGACGVCTPGLVKTGELDLDESFYGANIADGGAGAASVTSKGRLYQVDPNDALVASNGPLIGMPGLTSGTPLATFSTGLGDDRYVTSTWETYTIVFGGESAATARTYDEDGTLLEGPAFIQGDGTFGNRGGVKGITAGDTQTYYALLLGADSSRPATLRNFDDEHNEIATTGELFDGNNTYDSTLPRNALCRFGNTIAVAHSAYYPTGRTQRLVLFFCDLGCNVTASEVEVNDQSPPTDGYDKFVALMAGPSNTVGVVWEHQPDGEGEYGTAELRVRFFEEDGTAVGASTLLHAFTDVDGFGTADWTPSHADISASGNYIVIGGLDRTYDGVSDYTTTPVAFVMEWDGVDWSMAQRFTPWGDEYTYMTDNSLVDFETSVRRLSNGEWGFTVWKDVGGDWNVGSSRVWWVRANLTECM